jgi:hypothetical protein
MSPAETNESCPRYQASQASARTAGAFSLVSPPVAEPVLVLSRETLLRLQLQGDHGQRSSTPALMEHRSERLPSRARRKSSFRPWAWAM